MARVLLDTTVLIDVLRGRPAAARLGSLRGEQDVAFVCAINVEEVIRGLRPGEEVGARRLFNGMLMAPLGAKAIWLAVGGASLRPAASR